MYVAAESSWNYNRTYTYSSDVGTAQFFPHSKSDRKSGDQQTENMWSAAATLTRLSQRIVLYSTVQYSTVATAGVELCCLRTTVFWLLS